MLRLPAPGEDPGPLIAHPSPVQAPGHEDDHEEEEHEHDHDHDHAEEKEGSTLRFIAMMAVPGLLLLGLFAWLLMPEEPAAPGTITPAVTNEREQESRPVRAEPEAVAPPAATDAVQMEAAAKGFLDAPTVEQALKWIYRADELRPKVEAWYAAQPYKAPGFKGMIEDMDTVVLASGEVTVMGMAIRTGDFEMRQLPVVKTSEGYRVDWESWVAWSEMSWEDFKKQRPTEPKLFRVISSPAIYYNFEFRDESKWVSFSLGSLDGEDTLYGYTPVGSDLAARLRPLDGVGHRKVTLKLRFPENSPTDNQVLIEEIVGEDWLGLPGKR